MTPLEVRQLLAPVVATLPTTATFTPFPNQPKGFNQGSITFTNALPSQTGATNTLAAFPEAAAITSVSELTPVTSFGGDIVRIRSGPGGEFGNALYAISRGAGDNLLKGAINRPGVIYRTDTATGKASVFFDLNTVIPQLDPTQTSAAGGLTASTGLTNWYDITFDPEGYFDGRPSMFVSSVDSANPAKNAIYRIAPDGTFLGAFTTFSDTTLNSAKLTFNPTAILVPPPEQQTYLRGLIAGTGSGSSTNQGLFYGGATADTGTNTAGFPSTATAQFAALYFDSNQFRPGTPINSLTFPTGVKQTGLLLGPQVGLTAANTKYSNLVYDAFADFGLPAFPPGSGSLFPSQPGVSGVQGLQDASLLINLGADPNANANTFNNPTPNIDLYPAATTNFRRFQDVAFDQYGYFSQGLPLATTTGTTGTGTTGTGTGPTGLLGNLGAPIFAGSLFVSDLATGLAVSVAIPAPATGMAPTGTIPPVLFPVQGPGEVGFQNPGGGAALISTNTTGFGTGPTTTVGLDEIGGGRIVRIDPLGRVSNFAEGFNTSNAFDATSFSGSSLSITFSSDGTTLYASDDDGIWQFKTTASLAGSSSGSIIGLNDLRTLGVPYDGRNSAVDVIDTGVDANNTSFRGRVAAGTSTSIPGGTGNDDFAAGIGTTGTGTGTGGTTNGGNNNATGGILAINADGHGTPVAGIIAQFVPQATLNPINVFQPFVTLGNGTTGNTGGTTGGINGNNGVTSTFPSNAAATTDSLFAGFQYAANNPYVADPIRPLNQDRVIAASLAFGTTQTFETEQTAYRQYPQVVIAFKNQLDKFLKAGIAPIGAAGQLGATIGALGGTTNGTGGTGGTNGGNNNGGSFINPNMGATNNAQDPSVGDVQGMSLPAILNEVISVTGTYPFIYQPNATTPPTDPAQTLIGRVRGPVLVFGSGTSGTGTTGTTGTTGGIGNVIGGVADSGSTGNTGTGTTGTGTTGTGTGTTTNNLALLTAAESGSSGTGNGNGGGNRGGGGTGGTNGGTVFTFSDRLLGSDNRNTTTDFAAPALDAPTFRRTFVGDGNDSNIFLQGGTSISSAIVTGSYALVSSALEYWSTISRAGVTDSAYLTTPVGAHVLNYGPHQLFDLRAYNNPNGINSILAYSAVPAADLNDNLTLAGPPTVLGTNVPRSYARIDIGNAIATIEGKVAIDYLVKHGTFHIIDANHDGLITAQELQNFVNNAPTTGQAEAGAMARLLGGTARSAINTSFTVTGEQPDQPDVLQRRFNFFDYTAHGKLQGSISIAQFKLLNKYILPTPDAYSITDRQRASANGFLIAPGAQRNFKDLKHLLPKYLFVPKGAYVRYKGTSPAQFGVNHNLKAASDVSPVYSLFNGAAPASGTLFNGAAPAPGNSTATATATNSVAAPATADPGPITGTIKDTMTTAPTGVADSGVTSPIPTKTLAPAYLPASGRVGAPAAIPQPGSTTITTTTVTTTSSAPTGTSPASGTDAGSAAQVDKTSPLAARIAAILTPKAPQPASTTPPPPAATVTTTKVVPQPPTRSKGK